jgi:acyl-coenzyme A synthetase/AMP-(fatty) acid ligase
MLRRRRKTAPVLHAGPYPHGWEVPARFNFTRDVIEPLAKSQRRAALTFVDREGIVDRRTFAEVAGDGARWAHLLRTRLDRGDRVLVYTGKVPAWHGAMLGALKGGLISVPCSEMLRARDLAFRVRHSGARLVIADRAAEVEVEEMLEQLETPVSVLYLDEARSELARYIDRAPTEDTTAGERAFILYTSGTTKEPRGVVHTHAYTWALRSQAEHWLDVHEQDVVWCTAGTGWAKSIWNVLIGPWSQGAELVLHQGGFDAEERLGLMERLGVTVLCQAPTEYRMLAKVDSLATVHLPRLRHAVSAGEPLNPEVIERFQDALGITVHDGYGQTENSLLVANAPGMEVRPGSMGLPTPGHDVAVIDDHAQICGPGVEGDIALFGRPPTLFAGYWEAREESDAVMRDGWYVTGDRGVQDDDGYLWFVGRADDVILSSAYRIGPFEVESALLEHAAVAESAVVGAPDADRGEIVKAFVVLRPGTDPTAELISELQEHVKAVTAPYKYPREIAFVDELPKTTSGKIRRSELRRQPETGYPEPRALVLVLPVDEADRARAELEAAEEARQAAREAARRQAAAAAQRAAAEGARRDAEEATRLEEEAQRRAAAEVARQEAVEAARREAEESARFETEEASRQAEEEQARRAADEATRLEAEAAALREAEEAARREAEEAARAAAEEAARHEAEEAARAAAEEAARLEAEEAARREAEAVAAAAAVEAARLAAEEQARREAEEQARLAAAEEQARREAEEQARLAAEEAERRESEEQARLAAEEAERREAEEQARLAAEEAERREAEEEARLAAEEAERREAEEAEQRAAEEAARREAEEAEAARVASEQQAREAEEAERLAVEEANRLAVEEARRQVEEERERAAAEALARIEAAEAAAVDDEALLEDASEANLSRRERRALEKQRKELEKQRAKEEEERRKQAEIEAKERAKAEAEQRKRDEIEAKEHAKAEAEQRKRDEIEAKERAKADAEQRKRDEIEAKERAKADAEQRKRDEAAAREAAKQEEKDERRRQKELAKHSKGKGLGLGKLLTRDEEDDYDDDDTPVQPIENIVERLQPYARPRDPAAPVPVAPHEEHEPPDETKDSSDLTA